MADVSALREKVHQKFRQAFGTPDHDVGKDLHWSLRALNYIASINVLINGSSKEVRVWGFDPHDPSDGVSHAEIKSEAEAEKLIRMIEQRVKHAGRGGKLQH